MKIFNEFHPVAPVSDSVIEPKSLGEARTVTIPSGPIAVTRRPGDILWVPTSFIDSQPDIQVWLDPLNELIRSGSPANYTTPWILGSAMMDIAGNPRTSASHAQGRAMDISPMESDEVALSDSQQIAGLAWNLLSLAHLSTWKSDTIAWVVEGDHVHCAMSPEAKNKTPGVVLTCPTSSEWYAHRTLEDPGVASAIFGHLFLFSIIDGAADICPADDQVQSMLEYLGEAPRTRAGDIAPVADPAINVLPGAEVI